MRRDRGQFNVAFIDQLNDKQLSSVIKRSPSLVLIETPSDPLLRVVDIRAIAGRAKAAGAKIAVDNTFLSPALQRPIALGADFVIHSSTKYLNGHSDVVGGVVIAADKGDLEVLSAWANITGVTGAPFDAYLTLRGLRTLFPRIERQQATAATIAALLDRHPLVNAVHYPGLASHPQRARCKRVGTPRQLIPRRRFKIFGRSTAERVANLASWGKKIASCQDIWTFTIDASSVLD